MNKSNKKIIYILLMILIILSELYIVKYYYNMVNSKKESNFINEISVDKNEDIVTENKLKTSTERMLKLEELQKENSDIVAWIEIENTNIDYPVLQGSDNDFYMNHNYKKEYSINGSIFLDKSYSWNPPSSNLLIYGHNMKNNTMFQNLLNYKDKNFYNKHPTIRFTTNYEDVYYEIISVFESKVYYKSQQNVFKYYNFINSNNKEDFDNYVENVKKISLYDTGKTAINGEQLMTLSTCAYHTDDGRFVVVARKI